MSERNGVISGFERRYLTASVSIRVKAKGGVRDKVMMFGS